MRYAIIDEAGLVVTSHNDDTVITMPNNAASLTEAEWETRFDLKLDGAKWVPIDGESND